MNTCWEWQCCCHQEFHFLPARTEDLASPAQRGRGRVCRVTWRWPLPTSSLTAASFVIRTLVLTVITICGPVCIKWSWQATLHYWLLTPQSMWTKHSPTFRPLDNKGRTNGYKRILVSLFIFKITNIYMCTNFIIDDTSSKRYACQCTSFRYFSPRSLNIRRVL